MSFLLNLKVELAQAANATLPRPLLTGADFVVPPQSELGDLCFPCFAAAKALQTNPVMLAQKIAEQLTHSAISKAVATGPYVNVTLQPTVTAEIIVEVLKKGEEYGTNKSGGKKRVMLEYANGNTHKEYHVGHLRNIAFGDAVNRILSANGYTSIPVSYINDFGIHVAKTLWHYQATQAVAPEGNKGYFLGQLYAASVKSLEEQPERKAEVGEVMKAIESRHGDMYKLWQKTRQWSLDQMEKINQELDVTFTDTFYESDYIEEGLRIVDTLVQQGLLVKSEGAVIANLEPYNLGVLVVLRSDGTALYPVADLSLTIHKVKKYKLDTSLWVVDIRQGQYLKQLFKVLELYGLKAHLAHLPHEFVTLPSGMMSSRSGNVITYEELKEEAIKRTTHEITTRHTDWSEQKVNQVALVLALGALKFEMVKVSGEKVITFDMDTALRFEGFTAAYLQYTYARIQSLHRKAKEVVLPKKVRLETLAQEIEKNLAVTLGRYEEVVQAAASVYQPSEIARYLYELAQLFNEYYHNVSILQAADKEPELTTARLYLTKAVATVIANGLNLLGIKVAEEM